MQFPDILLRLSRSRDVAVSRVVSESVERKDCALIGPFSFALPELELCLARKKNARKIESALTRTVRNVSRMKSDRAIAVWITKEYSWKEVQNLRALARMVNREADLEGHNPAGFRS
jgi:hypothetical protein